MHFGSPFRRHFCTHASQSLDSRVEVIAASATWSKSISTLDWIAAVYDVTRFISPPETCLVGFRTLLWRVSCSYCKNVWRVYWPTQSVDFYCQFIRCQFPAPPVPVQLGGSVGGPAPARLFLCWYYLVSSRCFDSDGT